MLLGAVLHEDRGLVPGIRESGVEHALQPVVRNGADQIRSCLVDQYAIVLQFGKPVREVKEPGLNFKIPFIEEVAYHHSLKE